VQDQSLSDQAKEVELNARLETIRRRYVASQLMSTTVREDIGFLLQLSTSLMRLGRCFADPRAL
jgi:hypothetical protein